jgi:hypothetical protein
MVFPLSQKKARAFSLALFLLLLAAITYLDAWWPGIMLAIGLPIALRQGLVGKYTDMAITLVIFLGVFISVHFGLNGKRVAALLLFGGGLWLFFKEMAEEKKKELP